MSDRGVEREMSDRRERKLKAPSKYRKIEKNEPIFHYSPPKLSTVVT